MATASSSLCEDQLLCSICLDVFTEPVSTPCGHNFCRACLTQHWDVKKQCQCPLCNEKFNSGHKLCVNTTLRDIVETFKKHYETADVDSPVQPGQVPCDCCLEKKLKASKTCLVCLASFCKLHLEPHLSVPSFKRHKLVDPVENLEDKICKEHNKVLELFCRNDKTRVCVMCTEHIDHDTVPLEEENEDEGGGRGARPAVEQMQWKKKRKTKARALHKRKSKSANSMLPDQNQNNLFPSELLQRQTSYMPYDGGSSTGTWYYEVHTEGRTCWDIGVVRQSTRRERNSNHETGTWILRLGYCNYATLHNVPALGRIPEKVIIFVDYKGGLVAFHDAATGALLHMFLGCDFRARVFLFFQPSQSCSCEQWLLKLLHQPRCLSECFWKCVLLLFIGIFWIVCLVINETE